MPISARVNASIAVTQTSTPDTGQAKAELAVSHARNLTDGTANAQADRQFQDERTLATAANEDLDFAGGTLVDPFGAIFTAAEITAMQITADPTNTTNITFKPAAANGFLGPFGAATHTHTLKPGASWQASDPAGWPVTAGTGDLFNVANSAGASAKYKIAVLGRSA